MYYLPGTRWYIAELIEETSIGGFPRQIIQHNARFIFAHSPEEAYDKCLDKKKFRPFLATPPLDDDV